MKAESFCYWIQGLLEIGKPKTLDSEQIEIIKNHLNMVFLHDIDPKMGNSEHQEILNKIHQNKIKPEDILIRC